MTEWSASTSDNSWTPRVSANNNNTSPREKTIRSPMKVLLAYGIKEQVSGPKQPASLGVY